MPVDHQRTISFLNSLSLGQDIIQTDSDLEIVEQPFDMYVFASAWSENEQLNSGLPPI